MQRDDFMSRLTIGLAAMGGFTQRTLVSQQQVDALLLMAQKLGIRSADGATLYKSWQAVGRSIARLGLQNVFQIYGKCGRSLVPALPEEKTTQPEGAWQLDPPWDTLTDVWDWSPLGVRGQLSDTLQHLGVNSIAGLALHDPADCRKSKVGFTWERDAEPALNMLRRLRDGGVIREIGIGTKEIDVTTELLRRAPSGTFDYAGPTVVNLFAHGSAIQSLIPLCHEKGIDVVLAGPLGGGILCGEDPLTATVLCNYEVPTPEERQKGRLLYDICARHGVSLRVAALRFAAHLLEANHPTTGKPVLNRIVLGARNAGELEANVQAMTTEVPEALWKELARTEFANEPLIHPLCPYPGK